ncbi:TM1266 family iron-only hydrogenase system putative regulator [Peptostreptococcus equinus]|uniref:Iron-only hydrogenase system regulator n=1 Tax=Peptostreptococcus equinus TaxID=3003601 RepID=A0ABY7JMP0_9FIRM|nr:TM1266 family iron-only hydrogenase system putative regulator [Peptostreptococcus sp. CBA3647]WAW14434.1 iron-only hydrogenase system regulator [Peptostreptococcus sp. CBA3647]
MEKRVAVISAIIEEPIKNQAIFNKIVADFHEIVKGRMGLPFHEENIAVVSITVVANMNQINSLTGKLGSIKNITVKTAISKKEVR